MRRPFATQRGFTYLTVLFVVAFMSLGMAKVGQVYRTAVLRERETELLWRGNQYRLAIEAYTKRGGGLYPRSLDDLVRDPRDVTVRRYLRKRYPDPVMGSDEWGIVKAPDGGIMGVYSRSDDQPVKAAGFRLADAAFEGAAKYSDWKFVYQPGAPGASLPVPQGATGPQPGAPSPGASGPPPG
jgi:type II secretory pathway pseudopilin PulG